MLLFINQLKRNTIRFDIEIMLHTHTKRIIALGMTHRKIKTNGIAVFLHLLFDDSKHVLPKWCGGILHFCKTTNDECSQTIQHTRTLQLNKHAVNIVEIFAHIFQKQDFTLCLESRFCTQ